MFRLVYQENDIGPATLHQGTFDTEALAEQEARNILENGEGVRVVVLRPIAEFHITKTITMKEWKQMLKDQADG